MKTDQKPAISVHCRLMLEVGTVPAASYKAAMILFAVLRDYFGPGTRPSRDILKGCAYDLVQYKKYWK